MSIRRLVDIHDGSAPGADTNILSTHVTPRLVRSFFEITVAAENNTVFKVVKKRGADEIILPLFKENSGGTIKAGALYTASVGCSDLDSYNFRFGTDGKVLVLIVDEADHRSR